MKTKQRIKLKYHLIQDDCAMVTAADSKYTPYLFNTLQSIHTKFPDHPKIYVFDLGMTLAQKKELLATPWLILLPTDRFVSHWKKNWSWKPYILTQIKERYILYFDSANIVLYRPLELWFLSIKKHGYFVISNQQKLIDITPSSFWKVFDLDDSTESQKTTFGAGLIGYDREGKAWDAIYKALELTKEGFNLGRSKQEINPIYDKSIEHDCVCFRADQTLINLAFRQYFGNALIIRETLRYCGSGGPEDHHLQYLWYSRRHKDSLIYYWTPLNEHIFLFYYNRVTAYSIILAKRIAWKIINTFKMLSCFP